MLIQCLIEREGDTHVIRLENIRHEFTRNERGDVVCEVHNQEHIRWMLKSSSYREYAPDRIIHVEPDDLIADKAGMVDQASTLTVSLGEMVKEGKKTAKRKAA